MEPDPPPSKLYFEHMRRVLSTIKDTAIAADKSDLQLFPVWDPARLYEGFPSTIPIVIGDVGTMQDTSFQAMFNVIVPDQRRIRGAPAATAAEQRADILFRTDRASGPKLQAKEIRLPNEGLLHSKGMVASVVTDNYQCKEVCVQKTRSDSMYGALLYVYGTTRRWELQLDSDTKKGLLSHVHKLVKQHGRFPSNKSQEDFFIVQGYLMAGVVMTTAIRAILNQSDFYNLGQNNPYWLFPGLSKPPEQAHNFRVRMQSTKPAPGDSYFAYQSAVTPYEHMIALEQRLEKLKPPEPDDDDVSLDEYPHLRDLEPSRKKRRQETVVEADGLTNLLPGETHPSGDDGYFDNDTAPEDFNSLPLQEQVIETLKDPYHDRCVAFFAYRLRVSKHSALFASFGLKGGAEPRNLERHPDAEGQTAVQLSDESDEHDDDPVHHLLNYILEHPGVDAAGGDIEDVFAICQSPKIPSNFRFFLRTRKPPISVNDHGLGTLDRASIIASNLALPSRTLGTTLNQFVSNQHCSRAVVCGPNVSELPSIPVRVS